LAASAAGPTIRFSDDPDDTVRAWQVTSNLFDVLRVRPVLGRVLSRDDDIGNGDTAAVIAFGLWKRRFGGDPDVIGRTIRIGPSTASRTARIVGVAPPALDYPADVQPQVWLPLGAWMTPPGGRYLSVIGRLRDDVTLNDARAQTATILEQSFQLTDDRLRPVLVPLADALVGDIRGWILLLSGATALIALVAIVSVATLMLTKFVSRAPELAVRAALGASSRHLATSVIAEGLIVSLAAVVASALLTWWVIDVVKAALPGGTPRVSDIALDTHALMAAAGLTSLAGLLIGVVPAWRLTRWHTAAPLLTWRGSTTPPNVERWKHALVVAAVSLISCLLVVSTLFVLSFARTLTSDLGFRRGNLAALEMRDRATADHAARLLLAEHLAASAAEVVETPPLLMAAYGGNRRGTVLRRADDSSGVAIVASSVYAISPDYFRTLGIPVLRGRAFDETDDVSPVAILDRISADALFADGRGPIGGRVIDGASGLALTIVGVAQSVRTGGPEREPDTQLYVPIRRDAASAYVVFRTPRPLSATARALDTALTRATPPIAAPKVLSFDAAFDRITSGRRATSMMMLACGVAVLLIAAAGVYAAIASFVSRRRRAFSIRMALGATRGRIARGVLSRIGALVAAGLAIGLPAGYGLSRVFASFLFGVTPESALVYVVVIVTVVVDGLFAAALPTLAAVRAEFRSLHSD
jgi:predicted permease